MFIVSDHGNTVSIRAIRGERMQLPLPIVRVDSFGSYGKALLRAFRWARERSIQSVDDKANSRTLAVT